MSAALRPLRLPGFPSLGLAYLVNELGNWLGEIALARAGLRSDRRARWRPRRCSAACTSPPRCSGRRSSPGSSSYPARVTLPALYAVEAAAFAALALLVEPASRCVAVLALATLDGSIASAARALTRASAAAVLAPAGQLREGNALLNVAFTVGAAGGPAIAGLVVAGAGIETALLADAVSFLAVAVLLALTRGLASPGGRRGRGRLGRSGCGAASPTSRERPSLRRLLGAQAAAFVFFALVIPIEVVFAKQTLDAGDAGLRRAARELGRRHGGRQPRLRRPASDVRCAPAARSTLAIGFAYLGTASRRHSLVACAASVVGGLGNGIQWIALVTAVQELTRATYQARVLALLEALASAMPGVGFLLGGAIAAIFAPRGELRGRRRRRAAVVLVAVVALRRAERTASSSSRSSRLPRTQLPSAARSVASDKRSRTLLTDP